MRQGIKSRTETRTEWKHFNEAFIKHNVIVSNVCDGLRESFVEKRNLCWNRRRSQYKLYATVFEDNQRFSLFLYLLTKFLFPVLRVSIPFLLLVCPMREVLFSSFLSVFPFSTWFSFSHFVSFLSRFRASLFACRLSLRLNWSMGPWKGLKRNTKLGWS